MVDNKIPVNQYITLKKLKYRVKKLLGSGSSGTVYLAIDQRDKNVAIKIVDSKDPLIKGEIKYWEKISHSNIIALYDKFQNGNETYFIMEYARNGSLEKWLDNHLKERGNVPPPISEIQMRRWVRQILVGLKYLHELGFYHFDIKPSNILLDIGMNIKLSDFGTMTSRTEGNIIHQGCRFYQAPEVLRNVRVIKGPIYMEAIDIWATGVTFLKLFSGGLLISLRHFLILEDKDRHRLLQTIQENVGKLRTVKFPSEGCRDLIIQMLNLDPRKRIRCAAALKHWWMSLETNSSLLQRAKRQDLPHQKSRLSMKTSSNMKRYGHRLHKTYSPMKAVAVETY